MIKVILLDVDGILIKKHRYFSEVYAEKNGVPLEKVTKFFREKFGDCQRGKADLKVEIAPHLPEWGWTDSVDDFLKTWFATEAEIDDTVVLKTKEWRAMGIKVYLATDQEKYRAEYIGNFPEIRANIDGAFYSCDLGYTKAEKEFFEAALAKLNLKADEVLYFDDDESNVEVARTLDIKSIYYHTIEDLEV